MFSSSLRGSKTSLTEALFSHSLSDYPASQTDKTAGIDERYLGLWARFRVIRRAKDRLSYTVVEQTPNIRIKWDLIKHLMIEHSEKKILFFFYLKAKQRQIQGG